MLNTMNRRMEQIEDGRMHIEMHVQKIASITNINSQYRINLHKIKSYGPN